MNNKKLTNRVAAVILAAGEGTRINAKRVNKCIFKLGGLPMIRYPVEALEKTGIKDIIVVVKFAENSVRKVLGDKKIIYARQGGRKGTAAALLAGLAKVPASHGHVLAFYGDDSAFYTPDLFRYMLREHFKNRADVTLLSLKMIDPTGLGRILRDRRGKPLGIVEEKMASRGQKQIKEINAGCYCFKVGFLQKRLGEVALNPVSQEYYLTDILEIALKHGDRAGVCFYPDSSIWFGVNNRSQWMKAIRRKKREEGGENPRGGKP